MQRFLLLWVVLGFATSLSFGQVEVTIPKVFPKMDKTIPVGVTYHPEQVPEKYWDADFARIAKLGFAFVQIGEDGWTAFEPVEGKYDWLWIDRCLDLAARYKLKIVLNTGTGSLPPWLVKKYPQIEAIGQDGKAYSGKKLEGSMFEPLYQKSAEKLIATLAKRYGDNAGVSGWLIPAPHEWDYGPVALTEFQGYVRQQASQSLDTLKMRWGSSRGGVVYSAWDEIRLPKNVPGQSPGPAHLDFARLQGLKSKAFLEGLVTVLERYTTEQFICPVYAIKEDVATFSQTIFPHRQKLTAVTYNADLPTKSAPFLFALAHDQTHEGEPTAHAGIPIGNGAMLPKPGEIRRLLWQQYGLGAKFICIRTEGRLIGLVEADGETQTRIAQEIQETLIDLEVLKSFRRLDTPLPYGLDRQRVGILYDPDEVAAYSQQPQGGAWFAQVKNAYLAAKAAGVPVDFLTPNQTFNPLLYPLLLVPAFGTASVDRVAGWRKYVLKGGRMLLWPGTAQQTAKGPIPNLPLGHRLQNLIYTKIDEVYVLEEGDTNLLTWNKRYVVGKSEILNIPPIAADSVKVLARYDVGTHQTKPAIVQLNLGEGQVVYMGATSTQGSLERDLVQYLLVESGAKPFSYPENVYGDWNQGLYILTNPTNKPYTPPNPLYPNDRIIGIGPIVQPGSVGVYKWVK